MIRSVSMQQPTFMDSVREKANVFAASAKQVAANVARSVSNFFSAIAQKLSEWWAAGSSYLQSLSPEQKMAGAGLAIGAAVTALFCKCYGKKEEKEVVQEKVVQTPEGTTVEATSKETTTKTA